MIGLCKDGREHYWLAEAVCAKCNAQGLAEVSELAGERFSRPVNENQETTPPVNPLMLNVQRVVETVRQETFVTLHLDATVEALHLEPGDALLVRLDRVISAEEAENVLARVRERFPGIEVLVYGRGVTITRLRIGEAEARAAC